MVISPYTNFLASAQYILNENDSWWSTGISGDIESLPAGYKHQTILYAGFGINMGMHKWGEIMQDAYQSKRSNDVTVSHLRFKHARTHTHAHTHT